MRPPRTTRLLTGLLILGLAPPTAVAQVVAGQSLQGDWVRVVSNNNPNDLMRITINGTAVLTSVPPGAGNSFQVGQVLWQGIRGNGSLQVRGSDGNYYPATMTLHGPDEIELTVHYQSRTAGDAQTWWRAGPDIGGDWVQVAPAGSPGNGTRVQVQGTDASVRYLPAGAPRALRVGTRLWQGIGASGGLQALGSDGAYHAATWGLAGTSCLRVNSNAPQVETGQLWVRPSAAQAVRSALASGAPPPCP